MNLLRGRFPNAALGVGIIISGLASAVAQAETTWPVELYDPAATAEPASPADLVLPMPCGGAMAFQRVAVPVDTADPLADRRIRIGQSQVDSGYADYLRSDYLRGPFTEPAEGISYYFIARYELTEGQYKALTRDCEEPSRRDRRAQGGLSWFDAVDLSRIYSEWLMAEARNALPTQDGAIGYVRLPTEVEWEYAVRGGAKVDPSLFPARRFSGDEDLAGYAIHVAPGAGRGEIGAVGLRLPNPLGLFDVYGNVEELQLEPFRLNAVGRSGGQIGGLVTRGGSALSSGEQIYSAQRSEYPLYRASDGKALASDVFGLRLVLTTHIASSDAQVSAIQNRWIEAADAPVVDSSDPLANLAALIEEELDPRRQSALQDLQLEIRVARSAADGALQQTAKSTLLSGAVFVTSLIDVTDTIAAERRIILGLVDKIRVSVGEVKATFTATAEQKAAEINILRQMQQTYLISYRNALETLSNDLSPEQREAAYRLLSDELLQAEQTSISASLNWFWDDLVNYLVQPDISDGELLAVAVAR